MSNSKSNKTLIGSSILLAFTSSLCCIMPILTIVGGIGGIASSLSWVEPLRPYLIGATTIILGFSFYQAYKPKPAEKCGCVTVEKKSFMSSKKFLWTITIVSALLISFPYYGKAFLSSPEVKNIIVDKSNLMEANLYIEGMNCEACENHVNTALMKQDGVIEALTNYEKGQSTVKFDKTRITIEQLASTAEKETGYKIKP